MSSKVKKSMIFPLYAGVQGFSGGAHMQNFFKYLFSCSKSHSQTKDTVKNFYVLDKAMAGSQENVAFLVDGEKDYNTFKNSVWNETKEADAFVNDLFYIAFVLPVNGKLISNIVTPLGTKEETFDFTCGDEVISACAASFKGDREALMEEIEDLSDECTGFIPFNTISQEDRLVIEKMVHKTLQEIDITVKPLISMSHHDQDSLYHVHRVIKKG